MTLGQIKRFFHSDYHEDAVRMVDQALELSVLGSFFADVPAGDSGKLVRVEVFYLREKGKRVISLSSFFKMI